MTISQEKSKVDWIQEVFECGNLFSFVSGGILLLGSGVCSFNCAPDTLPWCDAGLEVIHGSVG